MAYGRLEEVTITTDASGDATAYIDAGVGYLQTIIYTKVDFANGVDFTITGEDSGLTLWTESDVNASKTVFPRSSTQDVNGADLLYAASGTKVGGKILLTERIKIVIAQGGNAKSGTFKAIVGG